MSSGADRRHVIVRTWIACAATGAAAVVAEVLLLDEGRALPVGITIGAALITGIVNTRRLLARSQRTLITVKDLRRR